MSSSERRPVTLDDLAGRDVAVLGAGREGQAVWGRLRERHPEQPVTLYAEGEVATEFSERLDAARDRLVTGPFDAKALGRHDWLVRSPGVSPYRDEIVAATAAGARLTTATSLWFAEHPDARTICVTGTKGKSTTTALVARLAEAAGHRVVAAGNIGRPLLAIDPGDVDLWVIELSSYQLCDLEATPGAAVILNLSDEHLDWHGGRVRYRRDKLRLAELTPPGRLVANYADTGLREAFSERPSMTWFNQPDGWHVGDRGVRFGDGTAIVRPPVTLRGTHNLDNLTAAFAVAGLAEVLPDDPQAAVDGFKGLPHRLRDLGESDGLRFVDDSLATTPVATLAALEALDAGGGAAVTLLLGGLDRGLDWSGLVPRFQALRPHAVIGLPDSGRALIDCLQRGGLDCAGGLHAADGMAGALDLARRISPRPGTVLLSPGAPSFPHYADYRARGRDFARRAGFDVPEDNGG